ncbi:uncharacterized protein LAESUDRAFT_741912 [Laetiporus sulphureus 93-53]|uniref:Uncharacterized protein n=1 Tax=Laetiporus sulphureus 93-53 TaxID=1314785 RepID=A0A165G0S9_9APHY|nr:uncharacterized protein LAESUDRAFT_741912 [Laetiporus sulphureus 93-53]KZT09677.1 hypothetical protein LAESUDRAFT_741912 [Laetiporus sulphureus 93-53]
MTAVALNNDHPLALELESLCSAVSRYQHEAHATSLRLQRHSVETSHVIERAHILEKENTQLKEELAVLRAHPDTTPHPATFQVQELTLAHRRLSDKLTLTEESLLFRTTELAHARSDLAKARHNVDGAEALASRTRNELKEAQARGRELERRARAAEEERRLADLVVHEYADLVRTLEGRPRISPSSQSFSSSATSSSATLVETLVEGKSGLQRLLEEFNAETERLGAELSRQQDEYALLSAELEAECKRASDDRARLVAAEAALEKYQIDDNTAAKMVSRYMKFSQSSIDALQHAMEAMRARHAATTATLSVEIDHLQRSLLGERREGERLRLALDGLTEDISRETYGRRREISLRLAFLGREESLAEGLRRWIRRSRESFDHGGSSEDGQHALSNLRVVFDSSIRDAELLLESLNGPPSADGDPIGSLARVIAAQNAVTNLTHELHVETERRLELERRLAQYYVAHGVSTPIVNGVSHSPETLTTKHDSRKLPERLSDLPLLHSATDKPHQNGSTTVTRSVMQSASNASIELDLQDAPVPDGNDVFPASSSHLLSTIPETRTSSSVIHFQPTDTAVSSPFNKPLIEDVAEHSRDNDDPPPCTPPAGGNIDMDSAGISQSAHSAPLVTQEDTAELASTPTATLRPGPLDGAVVDSILPPIGAELQTLASPTNYTQARDYSSLSIPSHIPEDESELVIAEVGPVKPSEAENEPTTSGQMPVAVGNVFMPIQSDAPDAIPPSSSQLFTATSAPTIVPAKVPSLLPNLHNVKQRYNTLQHGFRDCYLALKEMKKGLMQLPKNLEMALVLQKAVERLVDFNEDARVELEIRVTDEARITSGYEALLTIPGAMSDEIDEAQLEAEIKAFLDGTDREVSKATQQFSHKLDDLEHDIAAVKHALHELSASSEDLPPPRSPAKPWSSWASGLLTPSRPASPAFGSISASPKPHQLPLSHSRQRSDDSVVSNHNDPFASLGLRISMPIPVIPASPSLTPAKMNTQFRMAPASYMLGLGARTQSFGLKSISPVRPQFISPLAASNPEDDDTTTSDGEEGDDVDSDVE